MRLKIRHNISARCKNIVRITENGHTYMEEYSLTLTKDEYIRILAVFYRINNESAELTANKQWRMFTQDQQVSAGHTNGTVRRPTTSEYIQMRDLFTTYDSQYNKKKGTFITMNA